ncbi:17135_t:CDS:2 [Funneliformis caledonium]|uniref:17135_t:CDS:1 n=1 Tax=Funneliformis caledonium TaxID=1117310 RepID=A0A9N9DH70_9GLOM|nr:17135_t:CDS:2 [Funneliformis caledonium]
MSQNSSIQLVFSDESAYNRKTLSQCYRWNFKGKYASYAIQEGPMNSNYYTYFIEYVLYFDIK